jgi:SAM-dependent methyltransferase
MRQVVACVYDAVHAMANPSSPPCKVCGSSTALVGQTPNEHSKTSPLHHFRCTACGLVFVGDHIEVDELGQAYGGLDQGSYYEEIKIENNRKMQASVDDLRRLASPTSRILDLGTGNGRFLEMLLDAGFQHVDGHEIPSSGDFAALRGRGCTMYEDFDYSTIPSNSYDVVTLLDVAEHVPDPLFLFRNCFRILKPGGTVYVHTPVVTRMDRGMHALQKLPVLRKVGQTWQRGRTSIFHLQNYTRAALDKALGSAGFHDITLKIRNELSWPVSRYVRVYLCQKLHLPEGLAPVLTPLFYPLLATNTFNANKAIVWARKPNSYPSGR